jgi:hypothetical protein
MSAKASIFPPISGHRCPARGSLFTVVTSFFPLPIAHCPLPIAYCLLPIAYSPLPIAFSLLRIHPGGFHDPGGARRFSREDGGLSAQRDGPPVEP